MDGEQRARGIGIAPLEVAQIVGEDRQPQEASDAGGYQRAHPFAPAHVHQRVEEREDLQRCRHADPDRSAAGRDAVDQHRHEQRLDVAARR